MQGKLSCLSAAAVRCGAKKGRADRREQKGRIPNGRAREVLAWESNGRCLNPDDPGRRERAGIKLVAIKSALPRNRNVCVLGAWGDEQAKLFNRSRVVERESGKRALAAGRRGVKKPCDGRHSCCKNLFGRRWQLLSRPGSLVPHVLSTRGQTADGEPSVGFGARNCCRRCFASKMMQRTKPENKNGEQGNRQQCLD